MVTLYPSLFDLTGSSSPTLHSPGHSPIVRHMSLTMSPLESPYPFRSASTPLLNSPTGSSILIDECFVRRHHRSESFSLLATSLSSSGHGLGVLRDRSSDIEDDTDIEVPVPLKLTAPPSSTKISNRLACDDTNRGEVGLDGPKVVDLPLMELLSNVAHHFPHFFSRPTHDKLNISVAYPANKLHTSGLESSSGEQDMSGGPRSKKMHSPGESKTFHRHLKVICRAQPQRLMLMNPMKPPHLKSEVATRFPAHDHEHAMKSLLDQNRLITQMNHRWNKTMNGYFQSPAGGTLDGSVSRSHKRARSNSSDSRTDTDDIDSEQSTCPRKDQI